MTRDEAIEISFKIGCRVIDRLRLDRPQWLCDTLQQEAAEDQVDALVALGLLKLDVESPQDQGHE